MSEETDQGEKEHAPSQRRLDQAREKGDVVRSADLTAAAAYAGLALFAVAGGGAALTAAAQTAMVLLDQSDRLSHLFSTGAAAPAGGLLGGVLRPLAPFFLVPAGAAIAAVLAQRALVFSGEKLAPKWSRLSPLQAFKQKFGRDGLFEFGKSTVKLLVIATVLVLFLMRRAEAILGAMYLTPAMGAALLAQLMLEFLFLTILITGAIAGLDYFWQRFEHLRRNRMTRQETVEEHKDQEGDPHTKAHRRQRAVDIATNQMLAEVPKADVVIVNPTHYAVALKWDRRSKRAPVCVAKGVDEIAARIRERAAGAGIPIHRDPPTARALHATVGIGQEIRAENYRAVAAAIRFAEAMRRRARAKGFGR